MQKRTIWIVIGVLGLLVIGGVGWYLGSPLFIDRVIEEDLPVETPIARQMDDTPEGAVPAPTSSVQGPATSLPDQAMAEETPAESALMMIKSGEIVGADAFHTGSGTAAIYELPDGSLVVRLEQLDVTNGPDLHLLLATGANPTGQDDLGDYLDLGPLKGNIGNQNYEIPAGVDPAGYNSVVIYCVPFHVVFAHAEL